jgi:hypothetical protein
MDSQKAGGKHKMNKDWNDAAEEIRSLVPNSASKTQSHAEGDPAQGIQHMYDLIQDAGTSAAARLQAALKGFSDNTLELAKQIAATGTTPEEGAQLADILLTHTMRNFKSIKYSVLHGHKKD